MDLTDNVIEEVQKKEGLIASFLDTLPEKALNLGIRIGLALVFFFIGMQLIRLIRKIIRKSMNRAGAEIGVIQFVDSFVKASLYIILILTLASSFGVDAASIVALLGSAGVAIGLAVQGSLSNLAGGVLILLLKPFKVGDYIVEGSSGKEGTVKEIQIFYTKLLTYDNQTIILPNGNLAQENPDTKFILIDSWPTVDGTEVTADQVIDNVYAAYYAEQESGFYAGMAAALSTTTGKVAVVNGIAYPSNVNYQYGFECGVKYVNGTEGMNVEVVELPSYAGTDVTGANVGGNYVGNFSDEATGKVLGNALIAEGVDILFVAAGGSGNGVFTAAKEAEGVKVIGCDVDQYDDGANGDSNIVLTSGLKVMHDTVYNVLNEVKDGSFKGANVTLTAADDATGFVSEEGRCQLTAEAIEKINAAQALLKEGKIVPAANFNGVTPETFTW